MFTKSALMKIFETYKDKFISSKKINVNIFL